VNLISGAAPGAALDDSPEEDVIMDIEVTRHDDDFATTGQLTPEQAADVARLGFRSLIDNRPDGEGGPEQPTAEALRAAAEAAGLGFAYQPVVGSEIGPREVETFARHLEELPKPVLAFCRTGARSSKLYRLSRQPDQGS
jgi:uncharacterized protein (TIGR01244 family)